MRPQLSHSSNNYALRLEIVYGSADCLNAVHVERVVNGRVGGNKALSRFGGFEALHLSFTSSKRLMRIFGSIVGVQSLLVQSREANFAKRRSVGLQFVGDDNRRNEALPSKQCRQQPQRRGLVALGLDQNLESLSFAVDSAPHVHLPSSDHRFIEMPTRRA
jgi:hypothetical protein